MCPCPPVHPHILTWVRCTPACMTLASLPAARLRLKQEVELSEHALRLLQDRLAGSEAAQLAAAVEQLSSELAAAQETVATASTRKAELQAKAKVSCAGMTSARVQLCESSCVCRAGAWG